MSYPLQRIQNLANRLGISFAEAASLCARKGARRRREKARPQIDQANQKAPTYYWQRGQFE